jgi:hypothetical protein
MCLRGMTFQYIIIRIIIIIIIEFPLQYTRIVQTYFLISQKEDCVIWSGAVCGCRHVQFTLTSLHHSINLCVLNDAISVMDEILCVKRTA